VSNKGKAICRDFGKITDIALELRDACIVQDIDKIKLLATNILGRLGISLDYKQNKIRYGYKFATKENSKIK
jgi:hypothetical protein